MIATWFRWCSILLAADGLLILLTGRAISGEMVPDRVANGLGLIAVGTVFGALALWRERRVVMTAPIFEPDASPRALAFVFAAAAVVVVAIVAPGIWLGVAR